MKYVMLQMTHGTVVRRVPVIFPNYLVHADVAKAMRSVMLRGGADEVEPVSAGEYNVMDGKAGGKSETLRLESLGDQDARNILMHDYFHGIDTV